MMIQRTTLFTAILLLLGSVAFGQTYPTAADVAGEWKIARRITMSSMIEDSSVTVLKLKSGGEYEMLEGGEITERGTWVTRNTVMKFVPFQNSVKTWYATVEYVHESTMILSIPVIYWILQKQNP